VPFLGVLASPPGQLQQCQCIPYSHTRCVRISTIQVRIRLIRAIHTGGRATISPTRYHSSRASHSHPRAASICRHIVQLAITAHVLSSTVSKLNQPGNACHSIHHTKDRTNKLYSVIVITRKDYQYLLWKLPGQHHSSY
jgi:hypothetical protein